MLRWNIFSIISLIGAAWVGLSAAVMYFTDAAPGALVLFPPKHMLRNLPDTAAITASTQYSITLSSVDPDLTKRLYHAGAWLVLPAGLTGCLTPPKPLTAR
nr:hypothetical protein [Amylibacter sp.]